MLDTLPNSGGLKPASIPLSVTRKAHSVKAENFESQDDGSVQEARCARPDEQLRPAFSKLIVGY